MTCGDYRENNSSLSGVSMFPDVEFVLNILVLRFWWGLRCFGVLRAIAKSFLEFLIV